MIWRLSIVVSSALSLVIGKGAAQRLVPDEPSCAACRISVQRVTVLGDLQGKGALAGAPTHVQIDGRGRYWVVASGMPQVFDSDGKFVTVVGNRGPGPGEFLGLAIPLPITPDSMLLLDPAATRATVFGLDFRPHRVVQTVRSLGRASVLSWPDAVLFNGTIQTRERFGWPLHVISFTGSAIEVLRSGGPKGGQMRPGDETAMLYRLTSPRQGNVWAANVPTYDLQKTTTALEPLEVLQRRPKWWSGQTLDVVGTPKKPPGPSIAGIEWDDQGRLCVFIRLAGSDWRNAWPKDLGTRQEVAANEMEFDKLYATRIEVIDPATGRLVTSGRVEYYVPVVLPGCRAAAYVPSSEGVPQIAILAFAFGR